MILQAESLKKCFGLCRLIKSDHDVLHFKIDSGKFILSACDKRRKLISFVDSDSTNSTDEMIVPADKRTLFESDTDINLSFGKEDVKISTKDEKTSKKSSFKKKICDKFLWTDISLPDERIGSINSKILETLLREVSSSAAVKDTKTEDEMKINQVHFKSDEKILYSTTRFHISLVKSDHINFDLSVISSDIPIIRNFCTKLGNCDVEIFESETNVFYKAKNSILSMSKIKPKKHTFEVPELTEFEYSVDITIEHLKPCIKWLESSVEGSPRLEVKVDNENISFNMNGDEISKIPAKSDKSFSLDIPVKIFSNMMSNIDSSFYMKYKHKSSSSLVQIFQDGKDFESYHFFHAMKEKSNGV